MKLYFCSGTAVMTLSLRALAKKLSIVSRRLDVQNVRNIGCLAGTTAFVTAGMQLWYEGGMK